MTVALTLRVYEGVILASDSATTLMAPLPDGTTPVVNVYNNANKVFNLYRGCPIGAMTWGHGFIGHSSISMLMKDVRTDYVSGALAFNPDKFQVVDVAEQVKKFVFEDRYLPTFQETSKPEIGLVVAGISSDRTIGEQYSIIAGPDGVVGPTPLTTEETSSATWFGQIEAITRLILGFSPQLLPLLQSEFGVSEQLLAEKLPVLRQNLNPNIITDTMPLQDAIDLAHFLVEVAVRYSQYTPGATVVGGEIEVAAMSKHEGFKWISRKHYYEEALNPHHLLPTRHKEASDGPG